jgi:SAM-dependent methyltransferase
VRARWEGRPDAEVERVRQHLDEVRDRVLDRARLRSGDTVLDVGAGVGLLTFGARERLGTTGQVIAVDRSVDVLYELLAETHRRRTAGIALQLGQAEALPLPDESVDVVLTRSVLIYVSDKAEAAREFARVLRTDGRVSLFEPINRRLQPLSQVVDFGEDADLVRGWESARLDGNSPMLDFDERDLERVFRDAGCADVTVTVEDDDLAMAVDGFLTVPGAPGEPPLVERWQREHGDEVASRLAELVRAHGSEVVLRLPHAYLAARKP